MTEMVERVARAIAGTGLVGYESGCHEYQDIARAAIEALREPTEAMIDAANADPATAVVDGLISFAANHGAVLSDFYRDANVPLRRWWRAMIDAALAGKAY